MTNIIEKLATIGRIADKYGAHSNINVRERRAVYTLPVHPDSDAAQTLAQCFFQEIINWGASAPYAVETRANIVTVTL